MRSAAQFLLLLWKNLRNAVRTPIWTLFEVGLPLVAFFALLKLGPLFDGLRNGGRQHSFSKPHSRTLFPQFVKNLYYNCEPTNCDGTDITALSNMCDKNGCSIFSTNRDDKKQMESDALSITFHKFVKNEINVTINGREPLELNMAASDDFNPYETDKLSIIDKAAMTFATEASTLTTPIFYQSFPIPTAQQSPLPKVLNIPFVIMIFVLVPMLSAINVTREISAERDSNIKEYLLVMGMGRAVYYAHHLCFALLKALPGAIAVSILVIIDQAYIGFHFSIAYLFFIGAQISLATLISAVVKKPSIATLIAFCVIPGSAIITMNFPVMRTSSLSYLACLNPGHAMTFAIDSLTEACYRDYTVSWFGDIKYVLPYGIILLILALNTVIFLAIAISIDYFASTTENIFSILRKSVKSENSEEEMPLNIHEEDPSLVDTPVDIELTNVHKTWPSGERAVRGIDVKLYRGQVTVLLGHNGAGKSTTFAMITGIVVPSEGTIQIGNGENAEQGTVGFCPQYNPIFPRLTVYEHLHFFASLKGVKDWTDEAKKLLEVLLLTEKKHTPASNLSGGMKRKLCIAIALIGNSRVVLLDEPTAGVDTGARRDIEKLLIQQKKERTFLLTTHYTDEAEKLGDRILIMANGKVVCSGSSHFLNKEFGAGYILSCSSMDSSRLPQIAANTMALVKTHVTNAKEERQHGHQFEIWLDKDEYERFPELFRSLEENHIDMGIESFGLSMNTLEQVFLRVGEKTGSKNREKEVKDSLAVLLRENGNRASGFLGYWKHLIYLQYKRAIYELIHFKSFIFHFLPIILILLAASSLGNLVTKLTTTGYVVGSTDLLSFHQCGRIGIEKSSMLFDKFKSVLPPNSECIEMEEIDNAVDWYENTAIIRRPPIIAAIAKDEAKEQIVLYHAPKRPLTLPPLLVTLIRAMSTTTFKISMNYLLTVKVDNSRMMNSSTLIGEFDYAVSPSIVFLLLALPIMMFRFIGFYVAERSIKFRHQQYLTGLSKVLFWSASFISDFLTFIIYYIPFIISCMCFGLLKGRLLEATPILMLTSSVSLIKIYIVQRLFTSKVKATTFASIVLMSEYFICLVVHVVKDFMTNGPPGVARSFELSQDYILFLDPQVSAFIYLSGWNTNVSIVYSTLFAQVAILFIIFFVLECSFIVRSIGRLVNSLLPAVDIITGRSLHLHVQGQNSSEPIHIPMSVSTNEGQNMVLEVDNLVKRYGFTKYAVKGVSFGVMEHECFALLGVNGAGKTSTFEVLTGSTTATSGSATVAGVDCATPARIGYCPQFDALMEELSGRQNLLILAALHGYTNPNEVTDKVIECVGMTGHANKQSKNYSGGQRRKISVAAALLAQNSLIILDEPTAGIDPVTRRDIWSVICGLRDSTRTAIVLTSHSMDEVEALCSRVSIMKSGLIVAQGTAQSLKSEYGNYFKLTVVADCDDDETLASTVREVFSNAKRLNNNTRTHIFEIPRESTMKWSELFSSAIQIAQLLKADDFCLSQASLEDAFLSIASDNN